MPVLAAGLLALSVQPVLARARRRVNRLIFGARDDPAEVLTRLAHRLDSTAAPAAILPSVVDTLATTLRLPHVSIEVTASDGVSQRVTHGSSDRPDVVVPLINHGEEIGRLLLTAGPGREPLGPADWRLLDTIAGQVSVVTDNVLLQRRLQLSLERVVTAREEERRRLRRDIHDGVGPTLAAAAMRLEVARSMLHRDVERASQLLGEVIDLQHAATRGVRELVAGLRPPVLDHLGLLGALRDAAAGFTSTRKDPAPPLRVDVDGPADLTLPAAVEVAAYRIVVEALANVVRHAQASQTLVRLWVAEDALMAEEETDDGVGLPERYRAGVGLISMRERSTEIGGYCGVFPARTGRGTTVLARLPIHASSAVGDVGGADPHGGSVRSGAADIDPR